MGKPRTESAAMAREALVGEVPELATVRAAAILDASANYRQWEHVDVLRMPAAALERERGVRLTDAQRERMVARYMFAHSRRWRGLVRLLVLAQVALALLEYPDPPWLHVDAAATSLAEVAMLLVHLFDIALVSQWELVSRRATAHAPTGTGSRAGHLWHVLRAESRWHLARAAMCVVGLALSVAVVAARATGSPNDDPRGVVNGLRLLPQVFRSLFVVSQFRALRTVANSIGGSFRNYASVLFLLVAMVVLYALAGWLFFENVSFECSAGTGTAAFGPGVPPPCKAPPASNSYATYGDSLVSTFVMLSTANYPNVTFLPLRASRWYALFFVAFMLFGTFLFSAIFLALIFEQYAIRVRETARSYAERLEDARDMAFEMVSQVHDRPLEHLGFVREDGADDDDDDDDDQEAGGGGGGVGGSNAAGNRSSAALDLRSGRVTANDLADGSPGASWTRLLLLLVRQNAGFSHFFPWGSDRRRRLQAVQAQILYRAMTATGHKGGGAAGMDASDFRSFYFYATARMQIARVDRWEDDDSRACFGLVTLSAPAVAALPRADAAVLAVVDAVLLGTVVLLVLDRTATGNPVVRSTFRYLILSLFMLELLYFLARHGTRYYSRNAYAAADALVVLASAAAQVNAEVSSGGQAVAAGLVALRVLRAVRVLRLIERFFSARWYVQTVANVRRVLPFMGIAVGLLACVGYVFSVIGIALFGGLLRADNPDLLVPLTEYARDGYYSHNFDGIIPATLTVLSLMFVNNFHIVMEAAAAVSRYPWLARLYFVLYYVFGVSVVGSLVVSFFVDAYSESAKHERAAERRRLDAAAAAASAATVPLAGGLKGQQPSPAAAKAVRAEGDTGEAASRIMHAASEVLDADHCVESLQFSDSVLDALVFLQGASASAGAPGGGGSVGGPGGGAAAPAGAARVGAARSAAFPVGPPRRRPAGQRRAASADTLPEGWTLEMSEDSVPFYSHRQSGRSQWERPEAPLQ